MMFSPKLCLTSFVSFMWILQYFTQIQTSDDQSHLYCRDSWVHNISFPRFSSFTCAKCFHQVFMGNKSLVLDLSRSPFLLYSRDNYNISYVPDPRKTSKICDDFLSEDECFQWRSCCEAAQRCCIDVISKSRRHKEDRGKCPATWDGVSCWKAGRPGKTEQQPCPDYFVTPEVKWLSPVAFRECDVNGTWFVHPEHGTEMSDYTKQCFNENKNIQILEISFYIDIIGKSLSIVFLVTAVVLLLGIRPLRRELAQNNNLKIHLNLFIAMLCHSLFTIVMDVIYLDRLSNQYHIYKKNQIWCRMIHALAKYFMSASFMCMFCEGWHLHKRITNVMNIGQVDPLWKYFIISWGIPFITVTVYVICRIVINNESCWIDQTLSYLEFIHIIPNLISLACNFVFLIHIQWTLCTTMRTDTTDRRLNVIRQSLRATVSLIPIFGLQCLFIIYRPPWPPYEIITSIVISSQGLLVTVLYFFNANDVKTEIKAKFCNCSQRGTAFRQRQPSIISTATKSSRISNSKYSSSLEVIYNKKSKSSSNRRESAPEVMSVNKIVKNGHLKPKQFSNDIQSNINSCDIVSNGLTLIDVHPNAAFKIKHSSWNGLPSSYDVKTSVEFNKQEEEKGHPRCHSYTPADENDQLLIEYQLNNGHVEDKFTFDNTDSLNGKTLLGGNLSPIPETRSSSSSDKHT